MIPGEIIAQSGELTLNEGQDIITLPSRTLATVQYR